MNHPKFSLPSFHVMFPVKNSVTCSRSTERLEKSPSRELTGSLTSTIPEMLMMPSVLWTESVTKEESSSSRRPVRESLREAEDLKMMMSVTSAKKRVTGLTSAEIREDREEEEDILLPDLEVILQTQEEEDLREEEEEDLTLHQADPLQRTPEEEIEEEEDLDLPTPERVQDLLAERTVPTARLAQELVPRPPRLPRLLESLEVLQETPEDLKEVSRNQAATADVQAQARTQDPRVLKRLTEADPDLLRRETDLTPNPQRSLIK